MKFFRPLEMDELIWMMYGSVGGVDIRTLTQPKTRSADPLTKDDRNEWP
jgi:hypothetical protein